METPAETARPARAVLPKGCPVMRVRDAPGPLFSDADFKELFPTGGRPAVSPARLALVSVQQFAEELTVRLQKTSSRAVTCSFSRAATGSPRACQADGSCC